MQGIVLIDKPLGISSQQVVYQVRKKLQLKKAGHTGTLDPLATGMLPVCVGKATKLAGRMLTAEKAYRVTAILGAESVTGDAEGEINASFPKLTIEQCEQFRQISQGFIGESMQLPPMYSALKCQGKPLYYYARRGQEIARKPRPISISSLKVLAVDSESFTLEVVCGKGTYIRTLVEDIAKAMGTRAYVKQLRRLWVAPFNKQHMVSLEDLSVEQVLPMSAMLPHLPRISVDAAQQRSLGYGQAIPFQETVQPEGTVFQVFCAKELIALAEVQQGWLKSKVWLQASDS
jgi:tRNA pseudouridine55 synthase